MKGAGMLGSSGGGETRARLCVEGKREEDKREEGIGYVGERWNGM